jgi:hypothetical protein
MRPKIRCDGKFYKIFWTKQGLWRERSTPNSMLDSANASDEKVQHKIEKKNRERQEIDPPSWSANTRGSVLFNKQKNLTRYFFSFMLCNFCFYLYLIFYVCVVRFDVTKNLEKFLVFFDVTKVLNKASQSFDEAVISRPGPARQSPVLRSTPAWGWPTGRPPLHCRTRKSAASICRSAGVRARTCRRHQLVFPLPPGRARSSWQSFRGPSTPIPAAAQPSTAWPDTLQMVARSNSFVQIRLVGGHVWHSHQELWLCHRNCMRGLLAGRRCPAWEWLLAIIPVGSDSDGQE